MHFFLNHKLIEAGQHFLSHHIKAVEELVSAHGGLVTEMSLKLLVVKVLVVLEGMQVHLFGESSEDLVDVKDRLAVQVPYCANE